MYYQPVPQGNLLFIPDWCYQDTSVPFESVNNGYLVNINEEEYRQLRRETYYACRWYPHLERNNIPVLKSKLVSFDNLREDLPELMKRYPEYQFIRSCGNSPKDLGKPIFQNATKASNSLMESMRTLRVFQEDHHHLLMRKVVNIEIECRCFYHERKLRAISLYCYLNEKELKEFQEEIIDFFDIYLSKLPYYSAVIEICKIKDDEFPQIVEFNSFGQDMYASSELFDWVQDKNILYHAEKPIFRMPPEYIF